MRATVRGSALKSCFIDMSTMLKKYDGARVFGIETTKDSITFTVDTGMCYTRTIPIVTDNEAVNMSMTVLFADISHFIPAKADITLDITQYYISILTEKSTITLQIGESVVAPYVRRHGKLIDLDYSKIRSAQKIFSMTSDLQKAYGRDFAINMYGDHALLKSPTLWIRTKSQGLTCVLSLDQLKGVVTFQPDFVEESERLEFCKGDAILSIPRIYPSEEDKFMKHRETLKPLGVLDLTGVLKELMELKRSIGVGEAEIHIYQKGFSLNLSKNGVSLTESYGDLSAHQFSFRYMVDIFIMCLNILSEEYPVFVSGKEGLICLENQDTSILISV